MTRKNFLQCYLKKFDNEGPFAALRSFYSAVMVSLPCSTVTRAC